MLKFASGSSGLLKTVFRFQVLGSSTQVGRSSGRRTPSGPAEEHGQESVELKSSQWTTRHPGRDLGFLHKLHDLTGLGLKFAIDVETVRKTLEELPFVVRIPVCQLEFYSYYLPSKPFEVGINGRRTVVSERSDSSWKTCLTSIFY